MENYKYTGDDLVSKVNDISNKIDKLISLLNNLQPINLSVALLPIAKIDDDGRDSVFDPIESMQLERHYGSRAFTEFVRAVKFQYKIQGNSFISSPRTVGVIHLSGDEEQLDIIRSLIKKINIDKDEFKHLVSLLYETNYLRRKFYKKHFPTVLPLSIYRHICVAPKNTESLYFSWLSNGYSVDKLDVKGVEKLVEKRAQNKVLLNESLDKNVLMEMDLKRLAASQASEFHLIRSSKINPRHEFVVMDDNTSESIKLVPQRSTSPVLVLQKNNLKHYHELKDFNQISELRKCEGKKRVVRTPVIEEYGLYEASVSDSEITTP